MRKQGEDVWDEKGWVVWNPHKSPPMVIHSKRVDAVKESIRLARMSPGTAIYVLEIVGKAQDFPQAIYHNIN